ncbi:MAG: hypothetical protein LBT46_05305 [Planctomycetaceae bacterium]|jgi:hypothetical protein|nr:hypothetical protein [Planctomycetaceae bacterium]
MRKRQARASVFMTAQPSIIFVFQGAFSCGCQVGGDPPKIIAFIFLCRRQRPEGILACRLLRSEAGRPQKKHKKMRFWDGKTPFTNVLAVIDGAARRQTLRFFIFSR